MNSYLTLLTGWSAGYSFSLVKEIEDEMKQTKNDYLAGFCQFIQFSQFTLLMSKMNQIVPHYPFKTSFGVFSNIGPWVNLSANLFCAAVKQGHYEALADRYNQSRFAYVKLPEKLGGRSVAFFSFFADQTGNILRVAMIVSSIALIALGQKAYGGAVLTGFAYQGMDQLGYVPWRISLFIENYMPAISLVGVFLGGEGILRFMAAVELTMHIVPQLAVLAHHKVSDAVRFIFRFKAPGLKEADASVDVKQEMSFQEIQEILQSHDFVYKINPAHCSKPVVDISKLPEDSNFDQFLTLFDTINWTLKCPLILEKIKIDCPRNPYALTFPILWMRKQLVQVVSVLKGEVRIRRSQKLIEQAMIDCSKILSYLSKIEDQNELQDALMKLAIEGGNDSGRAIYRVGRELLQGIFEKGIHNANDHADPVNAYEKEVEQRLQKLRLELIESQLKSIAKELGFPNFLVQSQLVKSNFSLGFYPAMQSKIYRKGGFEIICREFTAELLQERYEKYRENLNQVVKDIGEERLKSYYESIINQNSKLSQAEKQSLLEKVHQDNISDKLHLLLFVRLGVLRSSPFGQSICKRDQVETLVGATPTKDKRLSQHGLSSRD